MYTTTPTANGKSLNLSYFCIRFPDEQLGKCWVKKIHAINDQLAFQTIHEINELFNMMNKTHTFHLNYLSWLNEQILVTNSTTNATVGKVNSNSNQLLPQHLSATSSISSSISSSNQSTNVTNTNNPNTNTNTYQGQPQQQNLKSQFQSKPTLVALTNDCIFFYEQVPQSTDEWLQPSYSYSLLITRLILQNQSAVTYTSSVHGDENLYFLTRHGTKRGTVSHLFRCLSQKDFFNWTSFIEKQILNAVGLIKHVDFGKRRSFFDSFFWTKFTKNVRAI